MANKKKTIPQALLPKGYEIDNKFMYEMKKKQASVASPVQFRNEVWNPKNSKCSLTSSI